MPDPTSSLLESPSDARALLELGLSTGTEELDLLEAVADRLPGLDVLEVIGRGGMGVVYSARQRSLDRLVAVKVLSPELARRPEFPVRFEQEARILATLRHPGIVEVYDAHEFGGFYYIVMEYVAGTSLRNEMGEPMAVERVRAVMRRVCSALQEAHRRDIVHRDIKPENILLDPDGNLKVADFGLAKLISGPNLSLTASLTAAGTLLYMAPEQLEGRDAISPATDVYSVGVLAYELLTARLPVGRFGAPSEEGAATDELDEVIMRCLERDPARRFANATDLVEALNSASRRTRRSEATTVARKLHVREPKTASSPSSVRRQWPLFAALVPAFAISMWLLFTQRSSPIASTASNEAEQNPRQRECLTAHGQTECGYHCMARAGQVACADRPDMECLAAYGTIDCGYNCAKGYGKVECALEPEMTCAAAAGQVRCGPGCEADRGGIVCDAPGSSAPGPWESTGDWTCDTVAQHLRDCGLYDHPVLGALGWKLDALRPQWSQGKADEIKDLCRRHYQEVVTSECRTAP